MDSLFSYQIQSVFFELFNRLIDRAGSPTEQIQPAWVYPGQRSLITASTSPGRFDALIQQAAERYQVDPNLVKAVIRAESNFRADAISSAGAQGLMQLMPATAAGLGVNNPLDPRQNIEGGVRLLSQLLNRYDGNVALALAAYNAGTGAVDRFGGIPPFRETQIYVPRVLDYWHSEHTWDA